MILQLSNLTLIIPSAARNKAALFIEFIRIIHGLLPDGKCMKSSVNVRSLSALALLVLSSGQSLYAAEQPQQGGNLTWGVETEPKIGRAHV